MKQAVCVTYVIHQLSLPQEQLNEQDPATESLVSTEQRILVFLFQAPSSPRKAAGVTVMAVGIYEISAVALCCTHLNALWWKKVCVTWGVGCGTHRVVPAD